MKKIFIIIMICFMLMFDSCSSFAKTKITKYDFPHNVISCDNCVLAYDSNSKGAVMLIKNAIMKKGNEKNLQVQYDAKGKMTILKNNKQIFVDGKTTIEDGSKIYKAKIKGTSFVLSVYSGKKRQSIKKYDFKKCITKYKKLKIIQIMKISKNKVRVLFGNADKNGSGNSGGTAILDLKTGVVKKEAKYLFWPTSMDKKYVFSSTGGTILKAMLKSGKKIELYQKPTGKNNNYIECDHFKDGLLAYANSNGVYIMKKDDTEWVKIYDFSKQQQFVSNILVINRKQIWVQVSKEEDGKLGDLIRFVI